MEPKNYLFRKERLLRGFDNSLARVRPSLVALLGEDQTRRFLQESRQEYEALIPQIPYIGKNNPRLLFLIPASRYLAVYRAMQRHELGIEVAGPLALEMGTAELKALPSLTRMVLRHLWFSTWLKRRLPTSAATSQQRRYPGDFVFTYVEGDGEAFDYGVDYSECACCKFFQAEDAFELTPFVCAIDKPASEILGWGLIRTMTLAEGSPQCDFRFKKGGPTQLVLP